jgi:hypothetical protein
LDHTEQSLFVVGSAIFNNTFGPYPFVTNETSLFVTSVSTLDGTFNYLRTPVYGNSSAQSVIARPGGGAYVTGTHFNDLRLPNLSFVPPAMWEDAFVASIDGEGNWLWITSTSCVQQAGVCVGNEESTSMTLGPNGNLHVLGMIDQDTIFGENSTNPSLSISGGTDVFIWTINPTDGSSVGVEGSVGNGNEQPTTIISLGENLIVSGNFGGSMQWGNISAESGVVVTQGLTLPENAGFVASLSIMEQPPVWNWVRTVMGDADSGPSSSRFTLISWLLLPHQITDIVAGPDGTIQVAGEYWKPAVLDSLYLPPTQSSPRLDAFVAQLSSQGDWLNLLTVGGAGQEGMTRVALGTNSQISVAFDADSSVVTFADNTHNPLDRSVIVGHFEWDRDADGVGDADDVCEGHDDSVDIDNDGTADGCDDLIDSDDDGVSDSEDACPGFDDNDDFDGDGQPDGCDSDDDNDNVADGLDLCLGPQEDFDGYNDSDGCPDPDNDGDFVNDTNDTCPNVHATEGGNSDNNSDGCPDVCDGVCSDGDIIAPPGGGSGGSIGDCDLANNTNCTEEFAIGGGIGVGVIGGSIITRWLRPGTGKGKGGSKFDIGRVGDAKDAYDFIAKKGGKKVKSTGGSDHYFRPGVERQEAMSISADTLLDDYVEDDVED